MSKGFFSAQPINHGEQRKENICQCMNNSFERFICPTICTPTTQRKLTRPSLHDPCFAESFAKKVSNAARVCCGMDCDLWHAAFTAGAEGAAGSCLHNVMHLMQWTQTFRGHQWIYI